MQHLFSINVALFNSQFVNTFKEKENSQKGVDRKIGRTVVLVF